MLPNGVRARIDPEAWPRPGVYDWLQRMSDISEDEMQRVFNCGIGMLIVAPEDQSQDILDRLSVLGERGYVIGTVERKDAEDPALLMDPGSRSQG